MHAVNRTCPTRLGCIMECGCKRSSLVACLANGLDGHALGAQVDDVIHPVLDALLGSNIHSRAVQRAGLKLGSAMSCPKC